VQEHKPFLLCSKTTHHSSPKPPTSLVCRLLIASFSLSLSLCFVSSLALLLHATRPPARRTAATAEIPARASGLSQTKIYNPGEPTKKIKTITWHKILLTFYCFVCFANCLVPSERSFPQSEVARNKNKEDTTEATNLLCACVAFIHVIKLRKHKRPFIRRWLRDCSRRKGETRIVRK
jgi:hypothetical protein